MIDYCEEKYECRRALLLSYFKENFNKEKCYRMCDNCNKNKDREKIECTKECKIILGLLLNLKNKNNNINLTFDQIIDYLKRFHLLELSHPQVSEQIYRRLEPGYNN